MDPKLVEAIAGLLGAVAWPLVALVFVVGQRTTISGVVRNLESFTLPGGVSAKIRARVDREAATIVGAEPAGAKEITERQLLASERVRQLALDVDTEAIRRQIYDVAAEYERTRASFPSGSTRTRRMELIATKLRTLGLAAVPLLPELTASRSPGARLAAIAALQIQPAAEWLEWLARCVGSEKPFVGYHAAVAIAAAARMLESTEAQIVQRAIELAKDELGSTGKATDRWSALEAAEAALRDEQ